ALFAARLAPGSGVLEVARAARSAPLPAALRRSNALLQAVAVLYSEGYPTAVPLLEDAIRAFDSEDLSRKEGVRLLFLGAAVAAGLWDDRSWDSVSRRHLEIVRESGAVSALSLALDTRVYVELFTGELATANRLVEEVRAVDSAAEVALPTYGVLAHAAFRGNEPEARPLIVAMTAEAVDRGEGLGVVVAQWAHALLCNGHGRYRAALEDGQVATTALPVEIAVGTWWMVELVEAAARSSEYGTAAQAFEQVSETALASGSDWALGVKARCEAQLNDGERAESLHREAIDRLERTILRTDAARARLLYGEWLRRVGRRLEAREQLRAAHDQLTTMGLNAFADRARRELAATGEMVRKRTEDTLHDLTSQELHIARLAAAGLTNPDIGTELFISPRTVEWHMRKIFTKLGITSRRQLRDALEAKLLAG
ncbi:MAG: LuxR C-terminal-related transcriptional regulator, partial [Acidimicrobiales bacterium]|nr:LuxR C-terminal-related transcriptional regulator [Acidimicrobiales bacterium]